MTANQDSKNKNKEEIEYDVYIKNTDEDIVATIKSSEVEEKAINIVKENTNKFSSKKIYLLKNGENIYVESVQ